MHFLTHPGLVVPTVFLSLLISSWRDWYACNYLKETDASRENRLAPSTDVILQK